MPHSSALSNFVAASRRILHQETVGSPCLLAARGTQQFTPSPVTAAQLSTLHGLQCCVQNALARRQVWEPSCNSRETPRKTQRTATLTMASGETPHDPYADAYETYQSKPSGTAQMTSPAPPMAQAYTYSDFTHSHAGAAADPYAAYSMERARSPPPQRYTSSASTAAAAAAQGDAFYTRYGAPPAGRSGAASSHASGGRAVVIQPGRDPSTGLVKDYRSSFHSDCAAKGVGNSRFKVVTESLGVRHGKPQFLARIVDLQQNNRIVGRSQPTHPRADAIQLAYWSALTNPETFRGVGLASKHELKSHAMAGRDVLGLVLMRQVLLSAKLKVLKPEHLEQLKRLVVGPAALHRLHDKLVPECGCGSDKGQSARALCVQRYIWQLFLELDSSLDRLQESTSALWTRLASLAQPMLLEVANEASL